MREDREQKLADSRAEVLWYTDLLRETVWELEDVKDRLNALQKAQAASPLLVKRTRVGGHTIAPTAPPRLSMVTRVAAYTVPPSSVAVASVESQCGEIVKSLEDKIAILEKDLAEARDFAQKAQLVAEGHQREVEDQKAAFAGLQKTQCERQEEMESHFNGLLDELDAYKLQVGHLTEALEAAKVSAVQPAPVASNSGTARKCTRPMAIASVATSVAGPQPRAKDVPPPPFVAVLRRHAGLCRNYALHGVCGVSGCTRRHENVPHAVEKDLRRALRDKRVHDRRRPVREPPPPDTMPVRSCLKQPRVQGHLVAVVDVRNRANRPCRWWRPKVVAPEGSPSLRSPSP